MKTPKKFAGKWRIVETEPWDEDALDLVVPAHITFDADGLGRFQISRWRAASTAGSRETGSSSPGSERTRETRRTAADGRRSRRRGRSKAGSIFTKETIRASSRSEPDRCRARSAGRAEAQPAPALLDDEKLTLEVEYSGPDPCATKANRQSGRPAGAR
jgi:hypothetical protein